MLSNSTSSFASAAAAKSYKCSSDSTSTSSRVTSKKANLRRTREFGIVDIHSGNTGADEVLNQHIPELLVGRQGLGQIAGFSGHHQVDLGLVFVRDDFAVTANVDSMWSRE